jgi:hypothetical protein
MPATVPSCKFLGLNLRRHCIVNGSFIETLAGKGQANVQKAMGQW